MLKRIFQFLSNRLVLIAWLISIQLYILIKIFVGMPNWLDFSLIILGLLIVLRLVNSNKNLSFSITWVIIILIVPGFGTLLYLMFANKKVPKELRGLDEQTNFIPFEVLPQDKSILEEISSKSRATGKQFHYIYENGKFPVYKNTNVEYYSVGEEKFESMLVELEKAKKYIFLEYFIIREGIMWDSMLEILKAKAKAGVDVRVIYDDVGTIVNLPKGYKETLESFGIKVYVFNKLRPMLLVNMNNRDHRKILVIDGKVGYLGGINLGDEYVNKLERFGHWKDSAIKLEGSAVWSLTVMFLQFWNALNNVDDDIEKYNPHYQVEAKGYIQPYSDSPTDDLELGENIHLNFMMNAKKSLYIMTPYLIPGNDMKRLLKLNSESGVDVRIIVPHKPDKWYVHAITKSNYEDFLRSGIKIFEYTPGFIHSKNLLADNKLGIVGSANIDFRSYYLNFESGAIMYESEAIEGLVLDFENTFKESIEITLDDIKRLPWYRRFGRLVLGMFSPLL